MTEPSLKTALLDQFDLAWALTDHHLEGLTDADCFWRPAPTGPHVRRDANGLWRADQPEHERYDLGPPSIAWTTWHIIFWWSMAFDHAFGPGTLRPEAVTWPGDAAGVVNRLRSLRTGWRAAIEALPTEAMASTTLSRWPYADRPFARTVAWANVELAKNAAEIGQVRFLKAVASDGGGLSRTGADPTRPASPDPA